ncbi:restriction endonuclease subunit S [Salmonella enterica subsp. enterica serovar Rubislaw]|uniref:restriction endonuclease subunit S n=1 Tax=Salmonella enterica TaxID=28901 RepID=UPI0009ACA235|nr:restriction endonuclease subunit S [Salmonella enterica]EBO3245237.1 restriction endonuclease subunit S [Salmonella enterica subsp. enterica serovar Rubislaw]EFB8803369.1 restriction endonuclease subunit S [Escherichia coli]EHC8527950.1 restriction endonuclease subunit S [Salmonella enterica subsp. enterica serovar 11:r:-]ECG4187335.1 restriction endonuclease subunit S [Salmonella enterica subsp. enterica serovar Rubislaw]EHC8451815.1 restriction endonuclease subunit S [Salmonella enterica 
MSEMSYLEKLLDGVEVEWRNLGDTSLFEIANNGRKPVKASLRIAGETPYYGANNIQDYVDGYTHDGEYVLIAEDGSASLENYSIQYATGKFWANNHVHVVRGKERIHSRFLYHYLCIVNFLPFLTGGGRAKLTKGQLIEIPVPIPCPENPEKSLAIQSEIVRILDKFTALTAELTAELNMRKKQYNYYRDQLLSFKEGEVEWKALDDVFDIVAGGDAPKDALSEFETEEFSIPVLSNGIGNKSLYGWTDRAKIEKPSLTISARGTIGWTSYRSRPFFPIVRLLVLTPKIKLNLKYAYYFMKTIENNYKIPEAGIPQLTKPMLKDIKIPFPCPGNPEESYNEQARIAATLDKFDVLTNSITEGLPREIELRQKQYEYYRDLLFSFPKPKTVSN